MAPSQRLLKQLNSLVLLFDLRAPLNPPTLQRFYNAVNAITQHTCFALTKSDCTIHEIAVLRTFDPPHMKVIDQATLASEMSKEAAKLNPASSFSGPTPSATPGIGSVSPPPGQPINPNVGTPAPPGQTSQPGSTTGQQSRRASNASVKSSASAQPSAAASGQDDDDQASVASKPAPSQPSPQPQSAPDYGPNVTLADPSDLTAPIVYWHSTYFHPASKGHHVLCDMITAEITTLTKDLRDPAIFSYATAPNLPSWLNQRLAATKAFLQSNYWPILSMSSALANSDVANGHTASCFANAAVYVLTVEYLDLVSKLDLLPPEFMDRFNPLLMFLIWHTESHPAMLPPLRFVKPTKPITI